MIERIFCGAVTRGSAQKEGRMSYTEFVWFLLSEEVTIKLTHTNNPLPGGGENFNLKMTIQNTLPGQTTSNCNRVLVPLHGPRWRWTSLHVSLIHYPHFKIN